MRNRLSSLAQHCCRLPFWRKRSPHLVLTTHVCSWTSNLRNTSPSRICRRPVRGAAVIGFFEKHGNRGGVCHQAFLGAGTIGLSRKKGDLDGVARMTTTFSASETQAFPESEKYTFGQWKIDAKEVFLITEHCYCFVNLRPVVPGHVLVTTKKQVPRFTDLTPEEVTDLWLTAQRVGRKLEPFFSGTSLTLAIQDGPEAGQTVPHVHVHLLPRKKEDFENNDEIYDEIDKKEKELNEVKKEGEKLNLDEERKDRTREEMFEEASKLRALFQ